MQSGGVNRTIVSCVGLARTPLSFNFRQISYAETDDKVLLLNSTALNKPLPRTSLMMSGNCCWTLSSWCLNSCPKQSDLLNRKTSSNLFINHLFERETTKKERSKVNGLDRFNNIKCGKISLAVNKHDIFAEFCF